MHVLIWQYYKCNKKEVVYLDKNCTFYSRQVTVWRIQKLSSENMISVLISWNQFPHYEMVSREFFLSDSKSFIFPHCGYPYLLVQIVRTVYYRKRQLWPIKVYQWVNRSINSQPSDYWQLFVILQMYSNKIQFCKKIEQKITWNWFHEKN